MARLQILLAALLFGTTGTAQALGPDASPLAVGAARIAVGGTVLVAVAVALALGGLRGLARSPGLVLLAGAGVAVYQLAFFAAVKETGVAVGTVVAIGSGPVAAGLLERAVEGTWPERRWVGATVLAAGGVATLTLVSAGDAAVSAAGLGLALVAGAGYAAYAVLAKRLLRLGHDPAGVMAATFGAGAVLLLPVLALSDLSWVGRPSGAALALYLGLLPTALAYLLFARGLRRVTAAEATTIVLAEPVTAAALGALLLGERVGSLAALGALLVLAGLAVLALPAPRPRRRLAPVPSEP